MEEKMTEISVTSRNLSRLEDYVSGFGKTANDAIGVVLDIAEACQCEALTETQGTVVAASDSGVREFDADSPPSLKHTTVLSAKVDGQSMPRGQNYWNNIMQEATRRAALAGKSTDEIFMNSTAHVSMEERSDNGFKFIPEAGISVQGQNSDNAWRQILAMAKLGGFPVAVEFRWQQNDDAAYPGQSGSLAI